MNCEPWTVTPGEIYLYLSRPQSSVRALGSSIRTMRWIQALCICNIPPVHLVTARKPLSSPSAGLLNILRPWGSKHGWEENTEHGKKDLVQKRSRSVALIQTKWQNHRQCDDEIDVLLLIFNKYILTRGLLRALPSGPHPFLDKTILLTWIMKKQCSDLDCSRMCVLQRQGFSTHCLLQHTVIKISDYGIKKTRNLTKIKPV